MLRLLGVFGLSVGVVLAIFYSSFSLTKVLPDYVKIQTLDDLLKILIDADGILLGFGAIVFAQLLSSIMDQQNIIYQHMLEHTTTSSNRMISLRFLDNRKSALSLITVLMFGSLLLSIFSAMSNIAMLSKYEPTDTFSTSGSLFGPLFFAIAGVISLTLSLTALPLRPPLEGVQADDQPKT